MVEILKTDTFLKGTPMSSGEMISDPEAFAILLERLVQAFAQDAGRTATGEVVALKTPSVEQGTWLNTPDIIASGDGGRIAA